MSSIKLYADDYRRAPTGWTLSLTVEAAKQLILTNEIEQMSLDYDFGMGQPTGLDLLYWIRDEKKWPRVKPLVHSTHPRAIKMLLFIEHYGPYEEPDVET